MGQMIWFENLIYSNIIVNLECYYSLQGKYLKTTALRPAQNACIQLKRH